MRKVLIRIWFQIRFPTQLPGLWAFKLLAKKPSFLNKTSIVPPDLHLSILPSLAANSLALGLLLQVHLTLVYKNFQVGNLALPTGYYTVSASNKLQAYILGIQSSKPF